MSAKADLARNVDLKNCRSSFVLRHAQTLCTTWDATCDLLAVQLHNQLLVHRQLYIIPLRKRGYTAFEVVAIDLNPVRRIRVPGEFFCLLQNWQLLAGLANLDLFPDCNL